jgi:hypothetical protein
VRTVIGLLLVISSLAGVWALACTEGAFKVDVSPTIPAEAIKLVVEHPTTQPYFEVQAPTSQPYLQLVMPALPAGLFENQWHIFNGKTIPILLGVIALLLLFIRPPHEWLKRRL